MRELISLVLSHPVCGSLLQQPWESNTEHEVSGSPSASAILMRGRSPSREGRRRLSCGRRSPWSTMQTHEAATGDSASPWPMTLSVELGSNGLGTAHTDYSGRLHLTQGFPKWFWLCSRVRNTFYIAASYTQTQNEFHETMLVLTHASIFCILYFLNAGCYPLHWPTRWLRPTVWKTLNWRKCENSKVWSLANSLSNL